MSALDQLCVLASVVALIIGFAVAMLRFAYWLDARDVRHDQPFEVMPRKPRVEKGTQR